MTEHGRAEPGTRIDVHNIEIDESLAAQHLCGNQHLDTGDRCALAERHAGGCSFSGAHHERKLS
ncbi:hypothetical protein BH10ACT8_BH10ACT8_18240 [soil metagenome]|jgi:hypothetical protein